jgi:hypothetical protein
MSASDCRRHRAALADLAGRTAPGPEGAAALAHLERCPACADVLGDLTLTVMALRRLATDVADPGDTTWSRLRDRIERSRRAAREQAWRWRTSLGGMLASALVVGALVGPAAVRLGPGQSGIATLSGNELEVVSQRIESDYNIGAHAAAPNAPDSEEAATYLGIRRYPDDVRPLRKEVAPARSTGLLPDAR